MVGTDDDTGSKALCVMCANPGKNTCGRCHDIQYCSASCQKTDWPIHKLLCKYAQDFTDDKRPTTTTHVRAILFSETEVRPRLIWLPIQERPNGGHAIAFTTEFLDDGTDFRQERGLDTSLVLHRSLGKVIYSFIRRRDLTDMPLVTYGNPNRSFLKIDEELEEHMRGPMIAYGVIHSDEPSEPDEPTDLSLADFRHVVDLVRYIYDFKLRVTMKTTNGEEIKGVRVNCLGDEKVFGLPRLQEFCLPFGIFPPDINATTSVTKKLGIPLFVGNLDHALVWRGRKVDGQPAGLNLAFATLTSPVMTLDFEKAEDIKDIQERILGAGSLFIAREDRKPLKALHLEAMLDYVKEKQDFNRKQAMNNKKIVHNFEDLLSKEEFVKWYPGWVKKIKEKRPEAAELPSPYDM